MTETHSGRDLPDIHCGNATVKGANGHWVLPNGVKTTSENTAELVAERMAVLIGRARPTQARRAVTLAGYLTAQAKDG